MLSMLKWQFKTLCLIFLFLTDLKAIADSYEAWILAQDNIGYNVSYYPLKT